MNNSVGPSPGASPDRNSDERRTAPAVVPAMDNPVAGRELRELKAKAQRLKPLVKLGKEGLSESFLAGLDQALSDHQLVKVKFDEFKEQKKELVPVLAAGARAQIIMRVGNVVVLFRRKSRIESLLNC